MSIFKKLFGDPNKKVLDKLKIQAEEINKLEKKFAGFSNEELRAMTENLKSKILNLKSQDYPAQDVQESEGRSTINTELDKILPEAFAVVREAAKRTLGQRHFDVQVMGAIALHQGTIAEMKTGEGKTLVSTMPVYLNALSDRGVHVVTVNDYLARRDTAWMGQIYHLLGLSVACIQQQGGAFIYDPNYKIMSENVETQHAASLQKETHHWRVSTKDDEQTLQDKERDQTGAFKVAQDYLKPCTRREAYQADITYGTNNEFGFDYLRDNMAYQPEQKVQRGLHYAVIDEVDSILIDEARTPLIISAPDVKSAGLYRTFAAYMPQLKENTDYNVDEKMHAATLTEQGIKKMEQILSVPNIYTEDPTLAHHLDQALKAHTLYKLDRDYIVKDGEIIIVDEFTGRLMYGRRYSGGLHQAIEAKEAVQVKEESRTLATITIQNYFRMYEKLSGMTGTAATEAEEFYKIYKLEVVEIPTNKPLIRQDYSDLIYKSEKGKFNALVSEIKKRHQKGQPVLVGTISIERNEFLSKLLEKAGVPHKILNAKQHEKEAEIIAQAGRIGAVTIATNMAGRGVDIVLGGTPLDSNEAQKIKDLGGLCVLGSERHESRRIDNQLRGRAGRQGDAGESQFFISMQDDLMRIFGSDRIKSLMDRLGLPEDVPIQNKIISRSIEKAQMKVEGHNFDIRKHLLEYDDVLNKQRQAVYNRRDDILNQKSKIKNQKLENEIISLVKNEIKKVVEFHTQAMQIDQWNIKEIGETVNTIFPITKEDLKLAGQNLEDRRQNLIKHFEQKAESLWQDLANDLGQEKVLEISRVVSLRAIDTLWMDHLEMVEYLRTGIGLRGYGQRDPLVEYKKEAFTMYKALINNIDREIVYSILKMLWAQKVNLEEKLRPVFSFFKNLKLSAPAKVMSAQAAQGQTISTGSTSAMEEMSSKGEFSFQERQKNVDGQKIGRNDPCPCSSGKKYKKCCGK